MFDSHKKGTIEDAIKLCGKFGSDICFSQGPGANISVKLNDDRLAIKSSGVRLDEVSSNRGLTIVDIRNLSKIYNNKLESTINDADKILKHSIISGGKPSMETGFHSFSANYTIHLHQINALPFLCSEYGQNKLDIAFPNAVWIDYVQPGHSLAFKLKEVEAYRKINGSNLYSPIMLKNHGTIFTSDSSQDAAIQALDAEFIFRQELYRNERYLRFEYKPLIETKKGFLNSQKSTRDYLSDQKRHGKFLFPDAVVFMNNLFNKDSKIKATDKGILYELEKTKAENINEIISAHIYVDNLIQRMALSPKYLSSYEVASLDKMPDEKYRRDKLII